MRVPRHPYWSSSHPVSGKNRLEENPATTVTASNARSRAGPVAAISTGNAASYRQPAPANPMRTNTAYSWVSVCTCDQASTASKVSWTATSAAGQARPNRRGLSTALLSCGYFGRTEIWCTREQLNAVFDHQMDRAEDAVVSALRAAKLTEPDHASAYDIARTWSKTTSAQPRRPPTRRLPSRTPRAEVRALHLPRRPTPPHRRRRYPRRTPQRPAHTI
jgi:hypothetical protein